VDWFVTGKPKPIGATEEVKAVGLAASVKLIPL
jgi:hypothetical protein